MRGIKTVTIVEESSSISKKGAQQREREKYREYRSTLQYSTDNVVQYIERGISTVRTIQYIERGVSTVHIIHSTNSIV